MGLPTDGGILWMKLYLETSVATWNLRHIARAWTMKIAADVNRTLGLSTIVICTPEEVIGDAGRVETRP